MKNISENLSQIIKAILPLFLIALLFFVIGKIGFTKINEMRAGIANAEADKIVLTEKLDLLRTVAVNGVQNSNTVTNALPEASPALAVIYQLRNLAAGSGLLLTNIKSKINPDDGSKLNSVAINFMVAGEKTKVEEFLININTIAPISLLNKVKITESSGVLSGEVSVIAYWSELPTQLPASVEGFEDLDEQDNEMLSIVDDLTQPVFVELPPAMEGGKPNPFVK